MANSHALSDLLHLIFMPAGIVLRELFGRVLDKRDTLDDNSTDADPAVRLA